MKKGYKLAIFGLVTIIIIASNGSSVIADIPHPNPLIGKWANEENNTTYYFDNSVRLLISYEEFGYEIGFLFEYYLLENSSFFMKFIEILYPDFPIPPGDKIYNESGFYVDYVFLGEDTLVLYYPWDNTTEGFTLTRVNNFTPQPEVEITISGGIDSVKVTIRNVGNVAIEAEWCISIDGGLLNRLHVSSSGILDGLEPGEHINVIFPSDLIKRSFGKVEVRVDLAELILGRTPYEKIVIHQGFIFGKTLLINPFPITK